MFFQIPAVSCHLMVFGLISNLVWIPYGTNQARLTNLTFGHAPLNPLPPLVSDCSSSSCTHVNKLLVGLNSNMVDELIIGLPWPDGPYQEWLTFSNILLNPWSGFPHFALTLNSTPLDTLLRVVFPYFFPEHFLIFSSHVLTVFQHGNFKGILVAKYVHNFIIFSQNLIKYVLYDKETWVEIKNSKNTYSLKAFISVVIEDYFWLSSCIIWLHTQYKAANRVSMLS